MCQYWIGIACKVHSFDSPAKICGGGAIYDSMRSGMSSATRIVNYVSEFTPERFFFFLNVGAAHVVERC